MKEAVELESVCDIGLTANVTTYLDGSATFLQHWLASKLENDDGPK